MSRFVLTKKSGRRFKLSLLPFFCLEILVICRVSFFIRCALEIFSENDKPFHQIARKRIHVRKNLFLLEFKWHEDERTNADWFSMLFTFHTKVDRYPCQGTAITMYQLLYVLPNFACYFHNLIYIALLRLPWQSQRIVFPAWDEM